MILASLCSGVACRAADLRFVACVQEAKGPSVACHAATARIVRLVVEPDRVLNRIAPTMFGACAEDVNHEIYGGLYAQRIYGESFEEPAPGTSPAGWRILDGEWTPDGAAIHVRGGNGPKLVRERAPFADGTVEARVRLENDLGENAGLLVRVSRAGVGADEFDGYEIALSAKARTIVLGKHRHDFHLLRSVSAPIGVGRWHRLRVVLSGPRIRVFLDDDTTPRLDYTDADPLGAGTFALRAWRADASFRDVRVDDQSCGTSLAGAGVSRFWDRVRTGRATARYALEEGAFNGTLCQRIDHGPGEGRVGVANRGLNRWGIAVRRGHAMEGRIYLHGDVGAATVALQSADGRRIYAAQRVAVGPKWAKASFHLRPAVDDPNARFALWIDRPGSLWADQAILLDAPEDRYRGLPIRRDIAEALVGSGLTFMRYGGTMVNVAGYRWKSMIGDPDRRPPYAGNWSACATNGFGIFDFLNFAERAKIAAAFAINVEENPADAADLADYLTAPATDPWGRRRAADGHPAPYRPTFIELGNEEAIGHPDAAAMAHYAERFRLLARAIHGRNPSLKLVCSAWWIPDSPSMKTVFDAVDGEAAAWDFHFWSDDPNAGTAIDRELTRAERLFKGWNPKTTLKAVVFEENGNRHDLQRALGHATTVNATRRHGDFVLADSAANALQPWRQNDNGWDQGGVFFTPTHAWTMPPADAQRQLSRDALPLRVAATAEGGLDVLATRSEDGRTLVLTVVNVADHAVPASLSLGSFRPKFGRCWILAGPFAAVNPPNGPKAVVPQESALDLGSPVSFPTRSVSSLRFTR